VRKCPTCNRPVDWEGNEWRPFCSERCKLIDFDKWTSEEYRVPGRQISNAEIQSASSPSEADSREQIENHD